MKTLEKKIRINTTLELLTGMHIGGSKDSVEIGGIDNPVIKIATKDNQPYIPGSSLKGKMRCLLEQVSGCAKVGEDNAVAKMFGSADTKNPNPSHIIVRDAMLTKESCVRLKDAQMDMPFTEDKYENTIDRVKGVAENPRQTERVPAGAIFDVEFVLNVWDDDKEGDMMKMLEEAIRLLENDYLGGSGSRGYGQVKFGELKKQVLSKENKWGTI